MNELYGSFRRVSINKDEDSRANSNIMMIEDEKGAGSGSSSTASNDDTMGHLQARAALKQSEASLIAVLRGADAQIVSLQHDKEVAAKRLQCAKHRHETVKEMTTRLCHECWSVLPALGVQLDDPKFLARNAPNCACCDQPTTAGGDKGALSTSSKQRTPVKMPPNDMHALELSWKAQACAGEMGRAKSSRSISHITNAESSHGGSRTGTMRRRRSKSADGIRSVGSGLLPKKTWSPHGTMTHSRRENRYDDTMVESKEAAMKALYLQTAKQQVDDAQTQVAELDRAIRSWEKYRSQHKEALLTNRMVLRERYNPSRRSSNDSCTTRSQARHYKAPEGIKMTKRRTSNGYREEDDARVRILEIKLALLERTSTGSRSTISTEDTKICAICCEHEKDVVFQCGHQCCKSCSVKLTQCPTCRQSIKQRITLFH